MGIRDEIEKENLFSPVYKFRFNGKEYKVENKSLTNMAFIVIVVGVLLTAVVFAVVLMTRGRKTPDRAAKKAKKKADAQAIEDSYEKIIDDKKGDKKKDNKKSDENKK